MRPLLSKLYLICCLGVAFVSSIAFLIGLGTGVSACLLDRNYTTAIIILMFIPVVITALWLAFRRYAHQTVLDIVFDSEQETVTIKTLFRQRSYPFRECYSVRDLKSVFVLRFAWGRKRHTFFILQKQLSHFQSIYLEAFAYRHLKEAAVADGLESMRQ